MKHIVIYMIRLVRHAIYGVPVTSGIDLPNELIFHSQALLVVMLEEAKN